jgi:hypothetical protein
MIFIISAGNEKRTTPWITQREHVLAAKLEEQRVVPIRHAAEK